MGAHMAGSSPAACACPALPWECVLLDCWDAFPPMPASQGCESQCMWSPLEIVRMAVLQWELSWLGKGHCPSEIGSWQGTAWAPVLPVLVTDSTYSPSCAALPEAVVTLAQKF